MGYRSDSIAVSRDMGPLSICSPRDPLQRSELEDQERTCMGSENANLGGSILGSFKWSFRGIEFPLNSKSSFQEELNSGPEKGGHYERGLFTGGISRISKISRFSRISREWSDYPLFSTAWGFSKIS